MNMRIPVTMKLLNSPGAVPFAILAALNSSSLAVMSTVLALRALELLGDARDVSLIYMTVAGTTLIARFTIPQLIRLMRRRWVYSAGAAMVGLAPFLVATNTIIGQLAGMIIQVFGAACAHIALNLYIMDYIARRDFVRSEPLKLAFTALPWALGPSVGVLLYDEVSAWAVYGVCAGFSVGTLSYFWRLRMRDDPTVQPAKAPPPNPLRHLHRFFVQQPRLRLAWWIAFGRDIWWQMLMIYGPLYMVTSGEPDTYAGYLVSAGLAMLALGPVYGWIGRKLHIRRVIMGAFALGGAMCLLVLPAYHEPLLAAALILAGTAAIAALDAVGGVPFLRAVHKHERAEMTVVYTTFGNAARFCATAVFSALLTVFDLHAVFAVTGLAMFAFFWISRHVPRGM